MLRLAFTFILLLLMLFGGAVWLLDLGPQSITPERQAKEKPPAAKSEVDELEQALKPSAKPADGAPSFDIARIDPNGISVFAGRAEPRSLVTITADGKEIGTAEADDNGEWTLTTDANIPNPDAKLALFKAPPGTPTRSHVVAAEPRAPTPGKPKTAEAVASSMLKSLEGMVAAARTEDKNAPAAAAAPAPLAAATVEKAPASPGLAPVAIPAPAPGAPAAQTTSVPVPVTFVFNEATLTGDGTKAASLLLEYLRLKRFPKVTLTGHADERGSDELNLGLSRERLETVARFLRDGGYGGELVLRPKGKSEPYSGVVRGDFSQEDLWQLDRRVELVLSR